MAPRPPSNTKFRLGLAVAGVVLYVLASVAQRFLRQPEEKLVFGTPGSGDHGPEPTFKGLTIDYGRAPPPPPPGAGTLTIDTPQSPRPTNGQIPIGITGASPRWADLTLGPKTGGCILVTTDKGVLERQC